MSHDVWVFVNGSNVIFRGDLAGCADAWSKATGTDKWSGSVQYESGPLNYDQQADKLMGLAEFMEDPSSGWREPPDLEQMREAARQLGRSAAASMDKLIVDAFKK